MIKTFTRNINKLNPYTVFKVAWEVKKTLLYNSKQKRFIVLRSSSYKAKHHFLQARLICNTKTQMK